MSLHLIHESDQKELTQWFKWKAKEKAKRISARKQRRRLAMKRIQHEENRELDETDDDDEENEGEDESDEEDDDSDSSNGSIGALHFTEDMDEDTESDSEYDVSDDETPMMKLVSGIDYLQSFICDRKQSKQLVSSNSLLSNPLTAVIAQARRRRVAKETRIRLAQLRPFDGLPISLPLKTCGRWIQIINLQQETPYPQRINPQPTINNEPPPPQLPPLQHQGDQAPFQHHQQQQHQQQQHQLILSRQGLLSSFIDALTHNRFEDDEQFGRRATGRSTRTPLRLRSRREFITDKSLQTILENCPRLCRLTISECHGVTDEGLKLIRDSECVAQGTLISLHMAGCYQITDQGLLNLVRDSDNQPQPQLQPRPQSSPQFESLDLAGCYRITDQGLSPLLRQCGTRLLQMRVHDCINITSESVITLSEHCPRIQWLDLGHSGKLTEAGLVQLASSCSELEWLSLARHHPDSRRDSGIHLHEGLADEQESQEGNHEPETTETNHQEDSQEEEEEMLISDRAVGLICGCCPKLHLLDLSYVSTITNDAIESLSKTAKSLVYLTIIGCPGITSQSLYYLARLRNTSGKLSCITMGDALGISEREIEQIMQGTLSGWQKSMVDETILGNILGRNWH
ncbi:hypothetical protein BGZ49_001356 [Haplosporangium sp. Z 27]|nr:hypothetical protein BGZ49_001356 [Haplosporangium sp. Z 27]